MHAGEQLRSELAYVEARSAALSTLPQEDFDYYLRLIGKYRAVTSESKLLEVGAGLGWFEVLCAKRGIECVGLEVNPTYLAGARALAAKHGVTIDLREGNIETTSLGFDVFDAAFATSVFEHVPNYARGLANIYDALKPGGVLLFYSTNKFAPRSGEFTKPWCYGWLPFPRRLRIRARAAEREGHLPRTKLDSYEMDFNQFTYWGLRNVFIALGFKEVHDRIDFLEPRDLVSGARARAVIWTALRVRPARVLARLFASGTLFLCVK